MAEPNRLAAALSYEQDRPAFGNPNMLEPGRKMRERKQAEQIELSAQRVKSDLLAKALMRRYNPETPPGLSDTGLQTGMIDAGPQTLDEAAGLDPRVDRSTFLPYSKKEGLHVPAVVADVMKLATASNPQYSNLMQPEEAMPLATNMMGGGVVASRLAPLPAGSLGMNAAPKAIKDLMPTEYKSAMSIEPPHNVRDNKKLLSLTESMKNTGWQGRPILTYDVGRGEEALTGSHRIKAAREANIEVPIYRIENAGDYVDKNGKSILDVGFMELDDQVKWLNKFGDKNAAKLLKQEAPAPAGLLGMNVVAKRAFTAPQDEALRLAQQRAALPVEQGGLGLPAGNTPQQRADAMGFDSDVYHGSANVANTTRFDPNKVVDNVQYGGKFYSSTSPDYANKYTTNSLRGDSAGVIPMKMRSGKKFEMDKPVSADDAASIMETLGQFDRAKMIRESGRPYRNGSELFYFGLDSSLSNVPKGNAIFRSGFDSIHGDPSLEITGIAGKPHSVVDSADNLRSRFAAFDPFRRNAALAAALGVAAPDLLAEEKK